MVNLNVISTFDLAKFIVKEMVDRGEGCIVSTASIAGTIPYETIYGATKAFVRSVSQGLREEVKDTGVVVTALMPGATETNFFHRAVADDTKLGTMEKDDTARVAKEGFNALMPGKDHVIVGSLKIKHQAAAAHVLPGPMVARAHASQSAPGTGNKK